MAKVVNTFIKSKMNKDLDARILPSGEYRDAQNVQVSRSEGDTVGSLENVLGVKSIKDFESITGVSNIECIGYLTDDVNNNVYLFFTDYTDPQPQNLQYSPSANNFIFQFNTLTNEQVLLVEGAFLNFSKTHPIYGVNIIEGLLFWTDNRNQPRKINTSLANPNKLSTPTYYTTEDQISVAKYNPYAGIELWQQSQLSTASTAQFETTMKDVTSKYLPNGGAGSADGAQTGTSIDVDGVVGYIYQAGDEYGTDGSKIYLVETDGSVTDTGETVVSYTYADPTFTLTTSGSITVDDDQEVIFNANPYYDNTFAGDPDFLEDKFVRFSYRFKFDDNEYSIMAPYTQNTFIPKQDGYFMYTENDDFDIINDQADTYRSTVVSFMENKVNDIDLRIPLPFVNYELKDKLKIKEIEVLYKQSDQVSAKVVDVITMDSVYNSSAICYVDGNTSSSTDIIVDGIQGGIQPGALVSGTNVTEGTVVESYDESTSTITVDTAQSLLDNTELTIGDPDYYVYNYQSKKPYKTIPENEIVRVYDKVPVRSLGQEISGNRIIYANYQDKHTPPASLNYNVACTEKADFSINDGRADVVGNFTDVSTIVIDGVKGDTVEVGSYVILETGSGSIPENTQIISIVEDYPNAGEWTLVLTSNVTLNDNEILIFLPGGDVTNTTSAIEYPNHSVKTNRNYQIGVVLSDRYGRQSTVILSNNTDTITVGTQSYAGSTLYHPYFNDSLSQDEWRGDSLKMLFNDPITPTDKNISQGWPGTYNGDPTSSNYNPLGWFSYKIVVKQNEQEYYNVYLPGIMAAYPKNTSKELNKTSHIVLINDNINKVPRDLTQVGPDQKQYRSSVQLFGRVENTDPTAPSPDYGNFNVQYYPGRTSDTASSISTMQQLFELDPLDPPRPNYFPQFYSYDSNPLISRISTTSKIGSIANTNYDTASGLTNAAVNNTDTFDLKNVNGTPQSGQVVVGNGIPDGVTVSSFTAGTPPTPDSITLSEEVTLPEDRLLTFNQTEDPGIQYLAVYETEPVQSLLEIFWETSTSGLVNELNDAVLNGSQGAADLSSFNVDDWDESYQAGDEILSADIYIIDNFGQTIPDSEIQTPLYLESVYDLNNEDKTSFFNFVNKATDYIHNIEITSAYYDKIFYFGDDNRNARTFTFTFKAVVNDVETTFVKVEGPGNVDPSFENCPAPNLSVPRSDYEMITFQGKNGAHNTALRNEQPLTYSVASVVGAEQGDVTDQGWFSVINQQQNGTLFDGTLVNNRYDDPTMPVDDYTITVRLTDAGGDVAGSDDCTFVFSSGVVPESVKSYLWGALCEGESVKDYWSFVIIEINTLEPSRNGWYLFSGVGQGSTDDVLEGWNYYVDYNGGNILPVNFTDASTVNGPCTDWWYSPTSEAAVRNLYIDNCVDCSYTDDSWERETVDTTDYTFYME